MAESVKQENMEYNWDNIAVGDFNLDHSENFFVSAKNGNNNCSDMINQTHEFIPLDGNTKIKKEPEAAEEEPKVPLQPKNENCDVPAADTAAPRGPSNLRLAWTPAGKKVACSSVSTSVIPKAYSFKDVYEHKRQDAVKKQEEDQRKARQFHSQPMPNFKACHKRLSKIPVVHKITMPKTPDTMKHWYADLARRKERQERVLIKEQEKSKTCKLKLLQEPSFQPKKTFCISQTDSKRIGVYTEQRTKEQLDTLAAIKCKWEQKFQQENDERKQPEMEEIKDSNITS